MILEKKREGEKKHQWWETITDQLPRACNPLGIESVTQELNCLVLFWHANFYQPSCLDTCKQCKINLILPSEDILVMVHTCTASWFRKRRPGHSECKQCWEYSIWRAYWYRNETARSRWQLDILIYPLLPQVPLTLQDLWKRVHNIDEEEGGVKISPDFEDWKQDSTDE